MAGSTVANRPLYSKPPGRSTMSDMEMFQQLHGLDKSPPTNSLPPHTALIAVSSSPPAIVFTT